MRFVDEAVITVRAGKGGDGSASLRRESYVPKGGPDGGDGGRGGSVVVRATAQLGTLEEFIPRRLLHAEDGKPGKDDRKSGKAGRSIQILLPVGTLIKDAETDEIVADLVEDGETFVLAKGGRGGRGNVHFATSINRTPRRAEPGGSGEERKLHLDLKLIADVGLVGRPNAGKSTLLSVLSRAHPKTASYPFTTLSPALGVVQVGEYGRFVMADIPGLAEGARQGRGLGRRFLRHIERTRLIVIMIEAVEKDFGAALLGLNEELQGFSPELAELPRLVILSKLDLLENPKRTKKFPFDLKVSSFTGEGLPELVKQIAARLGIKEEISL